MSSGLIIWAVHFTVIYGFNTLACTRAFADVKVGNLGLVPIVVIALTVAALAGTGAVLRYAVRNGGDAALAERERRSRILRTLTITVAALSLVAIA